MSTLNLKIIAMITMTIDHLGVFIFPGHIGFRIIGRLSFIIFAFLIANGFKYTKNYEAYLLRLLIMAFICQIPDMILKINYPGNIFFGLSLGLLSLKALNSHKISGYIGYLIILIIAQIADIDYGVYGVLTINFFYLTIYYNIAKLIQIIIFLILQSFGIIFLDFAYITYYSTISLFLIWMYNNKSGFFNKRLNQGFYLYYPVHITLIVMLKYLLMK